MKSLQCAFASPRSRSQWCLLGTGSGLLGIHLTLTYRIGGISFFAVSSLFWLAVVFSLWKQRHRLILDSSYLASSIGFVFVASVLLKSASKPTPNFLAVSPFLSALGLSLLASSLKRLTQYWRELTVLFFFGVPKVILCPVVDLSGVTASFAAFILWYAGFDARRQGFEVWLPHGGVEVYTGCSGFEGIFYLLGLAVLFLAIFPLESAKKNAIVPLVAIAIAFLTNALRIALMAIFADARDRTALDYWHIGEGSLIFSMIAVGLFGTFYYSLLRLENRNTCKEKLGRYTAIDRIASPDPSKLSNSLLNRVKER